MRILEPPRDANLVTEYLEGIGSSAGKFAREKTIPRSTVKQALQEETLESFVQASVSLGVLDSVADRLQGLAVISMLEWDTNHFGFKVARVSHLSFRHDATKTTRSQLLGGILEAAKNHKIKLVILRVPLDDMQTIQILESLGAINTDLLVTLQINSISTLANKHSRIAYAKETDIQSIESLASEVFRIDHFHNDSRIKKSSADELYSEWAGNCVRGLADRVIVVRKGSEVVGFITCKLKSMDDYRYGVIDLVAVRRDYQGAGYGSILINHSLEWFSRYTNSVYVGTQGGNLAALNLYTQHGFRICMTESTLHLWPRKT